MSEDEPLAHFLESVGAWAPKADEAPPAAVSAA